MMCGQCFEAIRIRLPLILSERTITDPVDVHAARAREHQRCGRRQLGVVDELFQRRKGSLRGRVAFVGLHVHVEPQRLKPVDVSPVTKRLYFAVYHVARGSLAGQAEVDIPHRPGDVVPIEPCA